jgi:ATP-binding cassette, subfamily B, bacterial
VTVLVTHRFTTARAADLIVVLDGGRVVEAGTHDMLSQAGGLYAELYRLQARYFV